MLENAPRILGWVHLGLGLLATVRGLSLLITLPTPGANTGATLWLAWIVWTLLTLIGVLGAAAGAVVIRRPSRRALRFLAGATVIWFWAASSSVFNLVLPATPPPGTPGPLQDAEIIQLAVTIPHFFLCVAFWFVLDRWARRQATPQPGAPAD